MFMRNHFFMLPNGTEEILFERDPRYDILISTEIKYKLFVFSTELSSRIKYKICYGI